MDSQLRIEINQLILKLPEHKLQPILEYIKQVEKTTDDQIKKAAFIRQIFDEDAELLKKLAQ